MNATVCGDRSAEQHDGFPSGDPEPGPGEEPAAGSADAFEALSGELAVRGRDGQAGQGDADERVVHRWQVGGPRPRLRCRSGGLCRWCWAGRVRGGERHGCCGVPSVGSEQPLLVEGPGAYARGTTVNGCTGTRATTVPARSASPAGRRAARPGCADLLPCGGAPRRRPSSRAGGAGCRSGPGPAGCAGARAAPQRRVPAAGRVSRGYARCLRRRRSGTPLVKCAPYGGSCAGSPGPGPRCRPGAGGGRRRTDRRGAGRVRERRGHWARPRWTTRPSPRG